MQSEPFPLRNHQTPLGNGFEINKRVIRTILDSIVRGLSSIGENVARVVLFRITAGNDIKMEDIPIHPQKFVKSLETLIGEGARLILDKINKEFFARNLRIKHEPEMMRFEELVGSACPRYTQMLLS